MEQNFPLVTYTSIQIKDGRTTRIKHFVAQEVPLEIRINGILYTELMRTPGLEQELAIGLCFTESLLQRLEEISEIRCETAHDPPVITTVNLKIPSLPERDLLRRVVLKKTSNGSRLTAHTIDEISPSSAHQGSSAQESIFDLAVLQTLPEKLSNCQELRARCKSTHGAALFDQAGEVVWCTEDVGRHNALDKLVGVMLLRQIQPAQKILVLSSRASFEMIQKAGRIGIHVVATISRPTDLALQLAERLGCTYVCFLKHGGFWIYTHPWRFGL